MMKRNCKKGAAVLLSAAMLCCTLNVFSRSADAETYRSAEKISQSAETVETTGAVMEMAASVDSESQWESQMPVNLNKQDYSVYGGLVSSYLVTEENGYMCVQYDKIAKTIHVDHYDEQFQLKSQQDMDVEEKLDTFIGFYAGNGYYYTAWSKPIPLNGWSADQTFMRIVKHDKKDWTVQGYTDINSDNGHFGSSAEGVVYPCDAGSFRMTEYQGHLYVNSCYEGRDTHQRSMMLDIVEEDMSLAQSQYAFGRYYTVVSHSFNQYLLIDDEIEGEPAKIVTLNHGDAGEDRGAALAQCTLYAEYPEAPLQSGKRKVNAFKCGGSQEDNNIGASFGGLERSNTSYLVAGNSADQTKADWGGKDEQYNIFVTATSRTGFSEENTSVTWLTDYKDGDGVVISTPQLTKMEEDLFLVMWREGRWKAHEPGTLCYTFVDGNGRRLSGTLGQTKKAEGEISDCKPVVKNGKAVWYSSGDEGIYFYTIDTQGNFEKHGIGTMDTRPALKKIEAQKEGVYLEWEPVEGAVGYWVFRRDEEAAGTLIEYMSYYVDGGGTNSYLYKFPYFQDCHTYEYSICAISESNYLSYGTEYNELFYFAGTRGVALSNADNGVKVEWNSYYDASEYRIYRSIAGESAAELVGTVKGSGDYDPGKIESFVDQTAQCGDTYDYGVAVCRGDLESTRYNTTSVVYLTKPNVRSECTANNTMTLSWDAVPGAKNYSVSVKEWNETDGEYKSVSKGTSMSADKSSCVVFGMREGTKYRFDVRANSNVIQTPSMKYSNSFWSVFAVTEAVYVKPAATPAPTATPIPTATPVPAPVIDLRTPSFTVVENTSDGVKLAWDLVEGADGYEIRCIGSDAARMVTRRGDESECVDRYASVGVTYSYDIRAYVQSGGTKIYSNWSAVRNILAQKPEATAGPASTPTSKPTPTSTPTAAPETKLPAPEITSIENEADGVTLAWDAVEEATVYYVYYYDLDTGKETFTGQTPTNQFTDQTVEGGKIYYYVVYAGMNKNGNTSLGKRSAAAGIQCKDPYTSSLEAPVLKKLNCLPDGSVNVEWEPVDGADGYRVSFYWADNPYSIGVYDVEGSDANHRRISYTIQSEGRTAYYYIQAYEKSGERKKLGEKSFARSIDIQRSRVQLSRVTNSDSGVEISWKPEAGADGYYVCSYESSTPNLINYYKVEGNDATSYLDKASENGKTYGYYVQAYMLYDEVKVEGVASETVKVQVSKKAEASAEIPTPTPEPAQTSDPAQKPDTPGQPVMNDLVYVTGGVKAAWNAVEGADGYFVYIRKMAGSPITVKLEGNNKTSYEYLTGNIGETCWICVAAYKNGSPIVIGLLSEEKSIEFKTTGVQESDKPAQSAEPSQSGKPSDSSKPQESNPPQTTDQPIAFVPGDVVGDDGKVQLKDAQFVLKVALRIEKEDKLTPKQKLAADVVDDEKITLKDAQAILKRALRIPVVFKNE